MVFLSTGGRFQRPPGRFERASKSLRGRAAGAGFVVALGIALLVVAHVTPLGRIAWIPGALVVGVGLWLVARCAVTLLTRRRLGAWAVAVPVLLLGLPPLVDSRRDAAAVAFEAAPLHRVMIAERGLAVTTDFDTAEGRDLETGKLRWRRPIERGETLGWLHGGSVLLQVTQTSLSAYRPSDGVRLWRAPHDFFEDVAPAIIGPTAIGVMKCQGNGLLGGSCHGEGLDIRTGKRLWRAPTHSDHMLGSPAQVKVGPDVPAALFPASAAVVFERDKRDRPRRYAVRDLASGRVLSTGRVGPRTAVGLAPDNGILHVTGGATTTISRFEPTGEQVWSKTIDTPATRNKPPQAGSFGWNPRSYDGWPVFFNRIFDGNYEPPPNTRAVLQLVHPRTGEVRRIDAGMRGNYGLLTRAVRPERPKNHLMLSGRGGYIPLDVARGRVGKAFGPTDPIESYAAQDVLAIGTRDLRGLDGARHLGLELHDYRTGAASGRVRTGESLRTRVVGERLVVERPPGWDPPGRERVLRP